MTPDLTDDDKAALIELLRETGQGHRRDAGFGWRWMNKYLLALAFLIGATTLEASGDAIVRKGLFDHVGTPRALALLGGGVLLLGYGIMLNLAPLPFERVVGLYIATLFVVWQVIGFVAFRSVPSLPILIGGGLIIVGGLIVSYWESQS